jgi:23S rRNA G2069 N7-methylase RlmK/C1962 C5-methylase RlmI
MLEDDGRGYFTRQQHVTPHIGKTAKRAVLSDEDFESRILKNPNYKYKDEAYLVADRLKATAEDDLKKATIEFYDDKFKVNFSVLSTVASYGVSFEQLLNFGFGITSSEYDSILVAWKEKVA